MTARMKGAVKRALPAAAVTLGVNAALLAAGILRAGPRRPDGRGMGAILGADPAEATLEHLRRLSRRDAMQLFHHARAPRLEELRGFHRAEILCAEGAGKPAAWFAHHLLPPGAPAPGTRWVGVELTPGEMNEGRGIAVFRRRDGHESRSREMLTWVSPTLIGTDSSASLHLDFAPFNRGPARALHAEVREVRPGLYICAFFLSFAGGPLNPAPFALHT